MTDLAGYRVYYGISGPPCPGPSFVQVGSTTPSPASNHTVTARLSGLSPGVLYYMSVTAMDTKGRESRCSTPASAVAQTGFSVSPRSTVDFGSVSLGRVVDQTFTVHNTGGGTVSGSAVASPPFSVISGSPFTLVGAGATQTVTVRFSPTVSATATANVTFTTTTGASTSRSVTGTAIGADPAPPAGTTLRVIFTGPAEGATVSGTVWVDVWVERAAGASNSFTLAVDDSTVASRTTSAPHVTLAWNSRVFANGTRTMTTRVRDASGNTGVATRTITVRN